MTSLATPKPSAKKLVSRLRTMSLKDIREATDLIGQIEEIDRKADRLRRAERAKMRSRATAVEALRKLLFRASDQDTADRILAQIEAAYEPAFTPPPQGEVITQYRGAYSA